MCMFLLTSEDLVLLILNYVTPDAQVAQRDHAAGCSRFGQKWNTGTRRHFTYITDLCSTTVT